MSKTSQVCASIASLLLLVRLGIDHQAGRCQQRRNQDIVWKLLVASQASNQFNLLWSQQFTTKEPVTRHGDSFADVAKITADGAYETQKNLILSLKNTECDGYGFWGSALLAAAFIMQSAVIVSITELFLRLRRKLRGETGKVEEI